MLKFIAHDVKNQPQKTNPFDEAIKDVLKESGTCYLLTPYFNIHIIIEFCKINNDSILITDIGELKTNISTDSELNFFINLIELEILKVYDVPNLHAKILLKGGKLLVGSANFTNNGMGRNHEGNILVSDNSIILEVNNWITNLIDSSKLASKDYLRCSYAKLPLLQSRANETKAALKELNRPLISVKPTKLGKKLKNKKNGVHEPIGNNGLISDIVKIFSNLEEALVGFFYFKYAYDLFTFSCENNGILSTTFTKDKKLTMNIGQWEVISIKRKNNIYHIVLGIDTLMFNNFNDITVIKNIPFSRRFAKSEEHNHVYLKFEWDLKNKFPKPLIDSWKSTMLYAINIFKHWISSSFKIHHHRIEIENLLNLKNNEIIDTIDGVFKL
ncbi:hypothetical protein Psfp_04226 [Pelotomaculum sp. FP]|uniref:phospholipase D-like domain-containing protein n=1 Tax=Pelotomaculum sp. FP TaxID=261474 RepID=UPI0010651B0E|nr:phospholipase D-like domain-containing protein [Pelotomaculum sp. FP]TEB09977.1 hypothetical protein Psfp_04226 [Pelotomaculum sp. FP]